MTQKATVLAYIMTWPQNLVSQHADTHTYIPIHKLPRIITENRASEMFQGGTQKSHSTISFFFCKMCYFLNVFSCIVPVV
jgi:hypothetical protein